MGRNNMDYLDKCLRMATNVHSVGKQCFVFGIHTKILIDLFNNGLMCNNNQLSFSKLNRSPTSTDDIIQTHSEHTPLVHRIQSSVLCRSPGDTHKFAHREKNGPNQY